MRMIGIIVLVLGLASLAWGGFSYTRDTTALKLGPVEVNVAERRQVDIPLWAGVGLSVVGGLLVAFGGRRG
ncbi:MAG: hypothetical protein IPM99_12765 [Rubrivivax sp.]|nr:hypothetical protein [Rubrivivax sp.]